MKSILFNCLVVCIALTACWGRDVFGAEIEKTSSPQEQLQTAVKLQFSADEQVKKDGFQSVIAAYKAVQKYFPGAEKEIDIANGNLAGVYAELGQKGKAFTMYKELLKKNTLGDNQKKYYMFGCIRCLPGAWGSKDSLDAFTAIQEEVDNWTGEMELEYAYCGFHGLLTNHNKIPINLVLDQLQRIELWLQKMLLNNSRIEFRYALAAESFLEKLPFLRIVALYLDKYRGQNRNAPPSVIDKLVFQGSPVISNKYPPGEGVNVKSLAKAYPEEMLSYVEAKHSIAIEAAMGVVVDQAKNGTLDAAGVKYLNLLQHWRCVQCIPSLERVLESVKDQKSQEAISKVVVFLKEMATHEPPSTQPGT